MIRFLPVLCIGFAYCSTQYFMLMTRLIGELTGNFALWSAIGSGGFLCALGLGILLAERSKFEELHINVAKVEILVAFLGPLSLVAIYIWHMVYRIYFFDFGLDLGPGQSPAIYIFAIVSQAPILLLGILSGLEVGLINRICSQEGLKKVQLLLALYHVGGLLATLILLLVLVPNFEPLTVVMGTGILNLALAGLWIGAHQRAQTMTQFRTFVLACGTLASLLLFISQTRLAEVHRKNFYYNLYSWMMDGNGQVTHSFPQGLLLWWEAATSRPDIERVRGLYQNIDFVKPARSDQFEGTAENKDGAAWVMYMDYRFQVNSRQERSYHEAMAHVPRALNASLPSGKILVIGGGDGLLVRELLRADRLAAEKSLTAIDLVDIDKTILKLAQEKPELVALNQNSLKDPRVELIAADAFATLRRTQNRYDAIYIDILYPFNGETSRLYSYEFFALVARSLNPGGAMTILCPLDFEDRDLPQGLLMKRWLGSTLAKAGFQQLIQFAEVNHSFLFARKERQALPELSQLSSSFEATLIEDKLTWERVAEWSFEYQAQWVNSILRPRFVGVRDPFF